MEKRYLIEIYLEDENNPNDPMKSYKVVNDVEAFSFIEKAVTEGNPKFSVSLIGDIVIDLS